MIKYRTENIINCYDWDKLVEKTYGKPYCLQQQDGCKDRGYEYIEVPCEGKAEFSERYANDSIPQVINGNIIGVKFKVWLKTDEDYYFDNNKLYKELFWQRSFYPDLDTIANDLHKKGLIKAGEYTIKINW